VEKVNEGGMLRVTFVGKIGALGTGSICKLNLKKELCELFFKKFLPFWRAPHAP